MKLTVIFVNNWKAFNEANFGGVPDPTPRRVTIELTKEQAQALKKQKVGSSQYEDIGYMFFESENKE